MSEWKIVRPQKVFVLFGFILMAVSTVLPWISGSAPILFGFSISRTGLEIAPEAGLFAFLFLVAGPTVVWFYDKFKRSGIICVAMGIWMLIEFFNYYAQLQDRVASYSTGNVLVQIGPGIYLSGLGAVIVLVGGIWLLPLSSEVEPEETAPSLPPAEKVETFFCRYCGAENKSDALYCEKCGKRLK